MEPSSIVSKPQKTMAGSFINTTKFTFNSSSTTTIKFLCSYGGKILPRYPDGKLRYHGGETRVLSVERSISFVELMVNLGEMCGTSMSLRCQLPTEDLDALVSITSDEDLANLIEEYDHRPASQPPPPPPTPVSIKIRAFLYPPKSTKKVSPTPSSTASSSSNESLHSFSTAASISSSSMCTMMSDRERSMRYTSRTPRVFPGFCYEKGVGKVPQYGYHGYGNASHMYLIHNGNHWQ